MHNNSPEQMPALLNSPAPDVRTREKLEVIEARLKELEKTLG